jgi:hypothetical protein
MDDDGGLWNSSSASDRVDEGRSAEMALDKLTAYIGTQH